MGLERRLAKPVIAQFRYWKAAVISPQRFLFSSLDKPAFLIGQVLCPLDHIAEHVPVVNKVITFWKHGEDLHNMECSPVCSQVG